ncbi:MAG: helix-turn-helix transcriptional regulator [Gemmatimonadota bacterium]|nr:helix-turn-helix transcriptional regulator [Gemmatimonadota bacterium]
MDQKKMIGENIRTLRKQKLMSQRDLAEKIGIAFQNLSVWENGKGAPSAKYLLKLAESLEVSLDRLTSPPPPMPEPGMVHREMQFGPAIGGFPRRESQPYHYTGESPEGVQRSSQSGLAGNHSIKLIISYLEEILSLLRNTAPDFRTYRQVADNKNYSAQAEDTQQIPLPQPGLSPEARQRWERNAAALLRWSQSEYYFWVPRWTLEAFCRDIGESLDVSNLLRTSNLLKDILEKRKP